MAATVAAGTAGTANAHHPAHLQAQAKKSAQVIKFFEGQGRWLRAPAQPECSNVPWRKTCVSARAAYQIHARLLRLTKQKLELTIPLTTNWTRAMRYAQRPFPGTYDWLEFISNRECRACYTTSAFICNYQGSGACGPMQFMSGTFYGHADDARRYLEKRGYRLDPRTWVWSSQLGQALTAAYMRYTGQDGCHWCL